ncbi:MAG: response regulator [Magnetococcales bacterium]|nr:response regulator [Magnetococcales bacterium]MBF0322434.1 response regulator [Magnetococcales bacterium]
MDSLLVVEDSRSFASLLRSRLQEAFSCEVVVARTFAEAKKWSLSQHGQCFLGILDLHLPDAPDGEIVDLILSHKIPCIVLTGEFKEDLRSKVLSKGVLDYFIKDNIHVIDSVIYFIQRLRQNQNIQVLVVDDSRSFRYSLCRFLRLHGFKVLEAADGEQALKILDENNVRMVISDYEMPGMDGFQLTKRIRAKYQRDHVAIIGLSSHGDMNLAAQFIKAGANDFLTKPFRNEELFCRVSQNVELIEKHEALEDLVQERTKRLEETLVKLRSRENHLKSVLESALDAIVTIDKDGRMVDFNPAAEKLFGFNRDEMLGKPIVDTLMPPHARAGHQASFAQRLSQGEGAINLKRRIEVQGLRHDGLLIDLEMALTSLVNDGRLFFTGFMHDITERKQLVKSLEETLTVAESANRAKSEFLANMSHEIRTPMNAVIGMTDLLMEGNPTAEQREYLEIVQNSSRSLLELINGILDLSKIEAGHLKLEQISFDLLGRIETACEGLAVKAHQKDLDLLCHVATDLPETLVGDPLRLNQILINLLGNAIKFTDAGEVVLRVRLARPGEVPGARLRPPGVGNRVTVHFSVSDTGIGIPRDRQDRVFERFTQADGSTTRQFGGSGLGLTISRSLVTMMNGEMWLESEEGFGSTFHFTAEFSLGKRSSEQPGRVMEERVGQAPAEPLAGLSVLTVWKSAIGREILRETLTSAGLLVQDSVDVTDMLANLDRAKKLARPFDLLILDHGIIDQENQPSSAWREHAGWHGHVVLLLPTHLRLEDVESVCRLDGQVCCRKPVKRFALLRSIKQAMGVPTSPQSSQPAAKTEPQPLPKPLENSSRILLVEDLINNQKLALAILERGGHRVTVANNGMEALEAMARADFDLILMDLQMPEMDGHETTRIIRAGDGHLSSKKETPIIAVTAHALEEVKQRCLEEGMNGFLRKPYRPQELTEAIAPFLVKSTPPVRQSLPKTAKTNETPVLKPAPGDPADFARQRDLFLREGPAKLNALRRQLEIKDPLQAHKSADWLKNVATQVGASRVRIKAMLLAGKAEMKNWAEFATILEELAQEVEKAVTALQATIDAG